MAETDRRIQTRALLLKLAAILLVFAIGGYFLARGLNIREILQHLLGWMRTIGPVPFFLGMALLPIIGFPVSAFSLTAGPVFGPELGLPLVCWLVLLCIFANLTIAYWLSRFAFRPLLEKIVVKLGYKLPLVSAEDCLAFTILVRVTPGPPFFVQNYLLGLSGVPFGIYSMVSIFFTGTYAIAVVLFGDSLINGRAKMAFIAFSGIIALTVFVNWIRRRYQKKKSAESL